MSPDPKQSPPSIGMKGRIILSLIKLFGKLPLTWARGIGWLIGQTAWTLKDHNSQITLKNLALCYPNMPEDERRILARESVIHTAMLGLEICVIQDRSFDWLKSKLSTTHGEDLIKEEIAKGKGVILLAPHIGDWEVMSLTLPTYGDMTALYQPPKQAYLEELIIQAREKTGATLVPTNRRGVAQLLKSIRSGGITAILPDQNPQKGSGEFAPFFGIPAYTMTAVHGFIQRSECSVIMGMVKRIPGGFETYFFKAPESIYSEDVEVSLTGLNEGVEQCIAIAPEQYQWEYKRFKRSPDGSNFYS